MTETAVIPQVESQHQEALRLFAREQYEQAGRLLAELLKLNENSRLWNDWATAKLMCNKAGESEQGYRRALELDPSNGRAAGNLGILLASRGRYDEAIPLLTQGAHGGDGSEREQLLQVLHLCRAKNPLPVNPKDVNAPLTRHALPGGERNEPGEKYSPQFSSQPSSDLVAQTAQPALSDPMIQMAQVIQLQSEAIAGLAKRISSIESRAPAGSATHLAPARPPLLRPASSAHPQPAPPSQNKAGIAGLNLPYLLSFKDGRPDASIGRAAPAITSGPAVQPQPGVLFRGLIYGGSGYGEENWMEALALAGHRIPVQLLPIGDPSDSKGLLPKSSRQRLESLQSQWVDMPKSVIYQSCPAGGWDMDLSGRCRVGRTMFETDRIPLGCRERCNAMDEVWVPSRFNMETFAASGVDERKLRLMPPGIDLRTFNPGADPLPIPQRRGFNFVSVFDWQLRKGYDVLLLAYLREFKPDEDVTLILKISQANAAAGSLEDEINFFIERRAGLPLQEAPPVILIKRFIPQDQMARLYAAADCFVLPTRGEGYGRPFLEALACELPVIATRWSGQTDFLTMQNSYLIESKLAPVPANVDLELFMGHQWAEPDIDHLRQLMREACSRRNEAKQRAIRGRQDLLRDYDWNVVIPRWASEFQRLLN